MKVYNALVHHDGIISLLLGIAVLTPGRFAAVGHPDQAMHPDSAVDVDKPGGRHQHQRGVPRGGGIAAFFFALGSYAFLAPTPANIEFF